MGFRNDEADEADDRFRDECGVFGIVGHTEASNMTYLGLHSLQHRGQESCGIVSSNDSNVLHAHRSMGLVADAFDEKTLKRLAGQVAIGHVRYTTSGQSRITNAQPLAVQYARGSLAVAHNGNLVNAREIRARLEQDGAIFQTTSDTECILHLVAKSRETALVDRISEALRQIRGAYSLLFLTGDTVYAARDPHGFRPLVLGRLGASTVVASETCAFALLGAEYWRDVDPGEVVEIRETGLRSYRPFTGRLPSGNGKPKKADRHFCVFELIYFARPDSQVEGRPVYSARKAMGMKLAQEHPADADLVIPVPDSGVPAAIGFGEQAKIPFEMGLVRSHYVGRTFIEPQQSIRNFGVKLKLSAVREVIDGKRVVVVDDSIVRGTTSRKIVKLLKDAGAAEVHVRISCPPTVGPCFYGIDTPDQDQLIAANHTVDDIRDYLDCDSLGYLSQEGLMAAVDGPDGFCDACFSLDYPIAVDHEKARDSEPRLVADD